MEYRTSLGVIESPDLLESSGMGSSLALSCNIRLFVIELDYGYRYLLEVCFIGYMLLDMVALLFNACIA